MLRKLKLGDCGTIRESRDLPVSTSTSTHLLFILYSLQLFNHSITFTQLHLHTEYSVLNIEMSTFTEINGSDLISALHLAQQAPVILGPNPKSTTSSTGTAEEYGRIEQLFLACLRTGDDQSASTCLNRLSHRFGPANERVMGLHGLYQEATAKDRAALEKIREEYEKILNENPVNVVSSSPYLPRVAQPGCS